MRTSVTTFTLLALLSAVQSTACLADARSPAAASKPVASTGPRMTRKLTPAELAARIKLLTPEQVDVTQHEGTEPPFHNAYFDNHAAGIYVDVVSGEPLFSSKQKFESGTGWPSFFDSLEKGNVVTQTDSTLGMDRTEVRSRFANSHLGHVFDDGPPPTGKRYCMDSASLRFIAADHLVAEGYAEYAKLFPEVKQVAASH